MDYSDRQNHHNLIIEEGDRELRVHKLEKVMIGTC